MTNLRTWPQHIYLQRDDDMSFEEDTTWCKDRINEDDVCYVRVDLYNSLLARLRKAAESGGNA